MDLTEFVDDDLMDDSTDARFEPQNSSESHQHVGAQLADTPGRASHDRVPSSPTPSSHRLPSTPNKAPSCLASKQEPLINDPQYQKTATALIQGINKTYAEWSKRKREFQLAITKSKTNSLSAGSAVEQRLEDTMAKGDIEYGKLRAIDEKYVLNEVITQEEQLMSANAMHELVKLSKSGLKIKLF